MWLNSLAIYHTWKSAWHFSGTHHHHHHHKLAKLCVLTAKSSLWSSHPPIHPSIHPSIHDCISKKNLPNHCIPFEKKNCTDRPAENGKSQCIQPWQDRIYTSLELAVAVGHYQSAMSVSMGLQDLLQVLRDFGACLQNDVKKCYDITRSMTSQA